MKREADGNWEKRDETGKVERYGVDAFDLKATGGRWWESPMTGITFAWSLEGKEGMGSERRVLAWSPYNGDRRWLSEGGLDDGKSPKLVVEILAYHTNKGFLDAR